MTGGGCSQNARPGVVAMRVEFELLGDIRVRAEGRPLDVGHARQQCVLAVLLVEANRTVPVDAVIDRVWAQRPPKRARSTVYNYLSRLRQALAGTDVRIVRHSAGYCLTVDPIAVDLHRFQHLVAQARASTDDQRAVALFDQALQLWRGHAFATLDTPWLNTVREGLDRQRLAAELDRNDLALALGQHTRLLADLSAGAATHPLDERLAGQLMLALYRSGRQADALAHFQQVRLRLADELGTDPSPPLRQLHHRILTTDPALSGPAFSAARSTGRSSESPVPRQLPSPPRAFTGRIHQLADLDALLPPAGDQPTAVVISAVSGTAGIGKTALAVHWAHRVADRFPDGQLYVNLRGFDPTGAVVKPAEAVRGFLDALGVSPQRIPPGLDAQAALYRGQLAGKRILVVLDNARDTGQVRPLLPGAPGCLVLVTSRHQLSGLVATEGAHPLTLDLLPIAEARDLLTGRLGANRLAAEPAAADDIITRCARLPLALAIVAARAATHPHFPLRAVADELRNARDRLDALADTDPASNVRAVFSWSYQSIGTPAARLFRLLGLHPGPSVSKAAAASLADLPPAQVRPLLAELARAHLIAETIPGRYTFHDLLRAYATEQVHREESHEQRHAAIHRMLDHYLHTARAAAELLFPARDQITLARPRSGVTLEHPTDQRQALAWFRSEHSVLLAAVERSASAGFETHTGQMAWTFANFLHRRGHWHDQVATGRTALAAARRLADLPAQARAHRILAYAYILLGHLDNADTHLGHAVHLYHRSGDHSGHAHTEHDLALMLGRQGRITEALDHDRRALALFQAVGDRRGQALALNAAGWYHAQLGHTQQALTSCQQALSLQQETGDRYGEAATWDSLGYAHHRLGHHPQAVSCFQHALHLARDLGDRYNEAVALSHLGDSHHATLNPEAARDAWQHALTILEDLDHPDAEDVRGKLTQRSPVSARKSVT